MTCIVRTFGPGYTLSKVLYKDSSNAQKIRLRLLKKLIDANPHRDLLANVATWEDCVQVILVDNDSWGNIWFSSRGRPKALKISSGR
jgi:hypothetical protein